MKYFSAKPLAHYILKFTVLLSTVRPHQVSHFNIHYADWLTIIAQAHSTWSSITIARCLTIAQCISAAHKKPGRPASQQPCAVLMSAKSEKAIVEAKRVKRVALF